MRGLHRAAAGAWLIAALAACAASGMPSAAAAPSPASALNVARLVTVIAVPDLRWTDVEAMPALQSLAARGSTASLADKTVGGSTGCLAGLLAIDAGTRTLAPSGTPATDCDDPSRARAVAVNRGDSYAADVDALGNLLSRAGIRRIAENAAAAETVQGGQPVAIAGQSGFVADAIAQRSNREIAVALDPALLTMPSRRLAQHQIDGWLTQMHPLIAASDLVVIAGTSDAADGTAHLHAVIVDGSGIGHDELTSPSTGRTGFVQLIDVGPTIAAAFGLKAPTAFDGSAIETTGVAAPTISTLADVDRHATADLDAALAIRSLLLTLAGLAVIVAGVSIRRPASRRVAVVLARLAAPVPLLSWLAQLVPWWRHPLVWLVVGIGVGSAVIAAGFTIAERFGIAPRVELLILPAATALLLVVDQLTGGGLQLSAPLGDDPLEAGRFAGVGNIAFAILIGSAILVAAVLATNARRRTPALLCAAAVLGVAVVVDGAPGLGDDLGGVLTAVPAAAVALAVLAGIRLSARRVVAVGVAAVGLAVIAALLDYSRPASQQTHLGHFVGQILHGGAATTLRRKAISDLELQGELPLVLAIVAWANRRSWWQPVITWLQSVPGLTATTAGVAVVAVIGSLVNDSGLSVAVFAIASVAPVYVAVACRQPAPPREVSSAG